VMEVTADGGKLGLKGIDQERRSLSYVVRTGHRFGLLRCHPSSPYQHRQAQEAHARIGPNHDLLVERLDLLFVDQNQDTASLERLDSLGVLCLPIDGSRFAKLEAVWAIFGVGWPYQPVEDLRLEAVVILHFLVNPAADQLSDGDALGQQFQGELA
jgi:hypothetical protein